MISTEGRAQGQGVVEIITSGSLPLRALLQDGRWWPESGRLPLRLQRGTVNRRDAVERQTMGGGVVCMCKGGKKKRRRGDGKLNYEKGDVDVELLVSCQGSCCGKNDTH